MSTNNKSRSDKEITLTITTTRGTFKGTFSKTAKVQDVINEVKSEFDLSGNGDFELVLEDKEEDELNPNRTLVSYGLEDEVNLILTMGGKNV